MKRQFSPTNQDSHKCSSCQRKSPCVSEVQLEALLAYKDRFTLSDAAWEGLCEVINLRNGKTIHYIKKLRNKKNLHANPQWVSRGGAYVKIKSQVTCLCVLKSCSVHCVCKKKKKLTKTNRHLVGEAIC